MLMAKCDWCDKEEERKNMKYWNTGHLLCMDCFNGACDERDKMMKEFVHEMKGCQESLAGSGW